MQQTQRFLRKLQQHTARRLASYRRELAPRAAAAAARSLPTIPPESLAMVLHPRATKLLIPNSGPYLVTGSTRHTYLLRNIATGFAFSEHRSNVRAMSDTLAAFRARDAPLGIGEMLGGAGKEAAEGSPQPKPATGAAHTAAEAAEEIGAVPAEATTATAGHTAAYTVEEVGAVLAGETTAVAGAAEAAKLVAERRLKPPGWQGRRDRCRQADSGGATDVAKLAVEARLRSPSWQ